MSGLVSYIAAAVSGHRAGWSVFWLCISVWNTAAGLTALLYGGFDPVWLGVLMCGLLCLPVNVHDVRSGAGS